MEHELLQKTKTWIIENEDVHFAFWHLLDYDPSSIVRSEYPTPRDFTLNEYHEMLKMLGEAIMPDFVKDVVFDGASLRPLRPIEELRDLSRRGPHHLLMEGCYQTSHHSMSENDMERTLSEWFEVAPPRSKTWIAMMKSLDSAGGKMKWSNLARALQYTKKCQSELPPFLSKILFGDGDDDVTLKPPKELQDFWTRNRGNWARLLLNCFYTADDLRRMEELKRDIVAMDQRLSLSQSFKAPRKGNALDRFIKSLSGYDLHYDDKSHYGRTIAFVQSSGAGKSKLMLDLTTRLPSITLCFRLSRDPTDGWPPADEPAQDFLLNTNRQTRQKAEVRAAAFLGSLMAFISEALERSSKPSLSVINDLFEMDTPKKPLDSRRHQSLTDVAQNANISMHVPDGTFERVPRDAETETALEWYTHLYQHFCLEPAIRLSRLLKAINHKWMVIGFDECSCLIDFSGERPPQPSDEMSILAIQRIVKAADAFMPQIPDFSFWFTLLDTNASIFELVPPKGDHAPSARLASTLDPVAAWYYFDFNVMVDKSSPSLSPAQSCMIKMLKAMGRPLWATESSFTVVMAAERKLVRGIRLDPKNENHVLAIFSQRIGLELGTGEAASRFAEEGVRSHMRILRGLVDRSIVFTRTPSEPMLAIAACNLLNTNVSTYARAVETLVNRLVIQNPVIDRGNLGQLFARLTLTIARDWATCNHDLPEQHRRFLANGTGPRVRMITLWDFLVALLGDIAKLESLKNYAQGVYLNFTHFHQLRGKLKEVPPAFLRNAWDRGVAFQAQHEQVSIDGLIVMYDGPPDDLWVESKLVLFGYQVKFKTSAMSTSDRQALRTPLVDGKAQSREIILLMDLGVESNHQGETKDSRIMVEETNVGGQQRWCISVRGHLTSYPCLKHFSPFIHKALLDPGVTIPQHLKEELQEYDTALDSGCELPEIRKQ